MRAGIGWDEKLIGRAGVSPPSRSAGADFYMYTYILKIVNYGGEYRDCIKRNGDKTWM